LPSHVTAKYCILFFNMKKICFTGNGRVFAWGNNEYGQHLITPKETRVLQPIQLSLVDRVFDIAAGGSFILLMLGAYVYLYFLV